MTRAHLGRPLLLLQRLVHPGQNQQATLHVLSEGIAAPPSHNAHSSPTRAVKWGQDARHTQWAQNEREREKAHTRKHKMDTKGHTKRERKRAVQAHTWTYHTHMRKKDAHHTVDGIKKKIGTPHLSERTRLLSSRVRRCSFLARSSSSSGLRPVGSPEKREERRKGAKKKERKKREST